VGKKLTGEITTRDSFFACDIIHVFELRMGQFPCFFHNGHIRMIFTTHPAGYTGNNSLLRATLQYREEETISC
jgi:hypothetical protein